MVTEPTFEWDDAKGQSNQVKHGVEKARRSMSNRTVKYTAGEIGRVRIVDDFLPAAEALVAREDNVKVTLSLSRRSIDFFKRAAKSQDVPYQRMIRALVDAYAEKQDKSR